MRFTDRVAVVTGGAQGIGAATAALLAAGGASVAVIDITAGRSASIVEKITSDGGRALAVACDVTDADAVTAMTQQVVDTWGRVDVLVNNAGITRDNLLFKMPRTSGTPCSPRT
jgi:3-oxoacyl-[acyl-carrier protein] reductase